MSAQEATISDVARTKEPTLVALVVARLIEQDAEAKGAEPPEQVGRFQVVKQMQRATKVVEIPVMLAIAHANGAGTDDEWPTQQEYADYWGFDERTAQRQWALYRSVLGAEADPVAVAQAIHRDYTARLRKRDAVAVAFDVPASLLVAA
jgi:hypothetical protein